MQGENTNKVSSNFGMKGWGIIVYCALLMFIGGGINAQGSNLISAQVTAIHGWEYTEVLRYFTYAGWLAIPFSILASQFIVLRGAKKACIITLLSGAAGLVLMAFSNNKLLYALSIVIIVCSLVVYSNLVPNTLTTMWFPRTKAIALGWSTMGFPLISIFFPSAFLLVMDTFGFQGGFLCIAGITILVCLVAVFWIYDMPEEAGAYPDNDQSISREQMDAMLARKKAYKSAWSMLRLVKSKTMWLASVSMGLLWLVVVGIGAQWIPCMVSAGFERSFAIRLLALNGAAGLPGSYFWGYIDQRFGTKKACVFYAIFYVFELFCLIYLMRGSWVYFVAVIAGIGTGGIANLIPSLFGTIWGRWDFPAVQRVTGPITNFLKGSAPLIISIALTHFGGYSGMLYIFMVLVIIALILLLFLDSRMIGYTE